MAIFLLIRHGENDWVGKKLAGRTPGVHLNKKGLKQAQRIADTFKNVHITAIYSSPLERTMETAAPLAKSHQLEIHEEPGLLELNFGDWQGKSIEELKKQALWQTVQQQPQEIVFPKGESFVNAQKRLVGSIETINQKYKQDDLIACFSHSDSIRLLAAHYLRIKLNDFQRIQISTASVTVIQINEHGIHVPFLNQIITRDFGSLFTKAKH